MNAHRKNTHAQQFLIDRPAVVRERPAFPEDFVFDIARLFGLINPLRLKRALARLAPDRQAAMRDLFASGHRQMQAAFNGEAVKPLAHGAGHLALIHSLLSGGVRELVELRGRAPYVDSCGDIWGFGKYQMLDPGWLDFVVAWLDMLSGAGKLHPFAAPAVGKGPPPRAIANRAAFGLVGDWGTGAFAPAPAASLQVINSLSRSFRGGRPDYAVHLGDVYYSGSPAQCRKHFLPYWKGGAQGAFTLNSNHEMYSGARGYFGTLLPALGQSASYFALENADWIIVALDTAYYADVESAYMNGRLDEQRQLPYLRELADRASAGGKRMVLLTHHNPVSEDGAETNALWDQVMGVCRRGAGKNPLARWYWGHVHAGVVYKDREGVGLRCAGHGAIPWGQASAFASSPHILWYETRPNPLDPDLRVMNGYAGLEFDGPVLRETFYDQTGRASWQSL